MCVSGFVYWMALGPVLEVACLLDGPPQTYLVALSLSSAAPDWMLWVDLGLD